MAERLLEVKGLKVRFATEDGIVGAVDGVDFTLDRGQVLGIVGESGSGKSVTSMTILGLTRGTNARFALCAWEGRQRPVLTGVCEFTVAQFASLAQAASHYLAQMHAPRPRRSRGVRPHQVRSAAPLSPPSPNRPDRGGRAETEARRGGRVLRDPGRALGRGRGHRAATERVAT